MSLLSHTEYDRLQCSRLSKIRKTHRQTEKRHERILCGLTEIKLAGTGTATYAMSFWVMAPCLEISTATVEVIEPGAFANYL